MNLTFIFNNSSSPSPGFFLSIDLILICFSRLLSFLSSFSRMLNFLSRGNMLWSMMGFRFRSPLLHFFSLLTLMSYLLAGLTEAWLPLIIHLLLQHSSFNILYGCVLHKMLSNVHLHKDSSMQYPQLTSSTLISYQRSSYNTSNFVQTLDSS